MMLGGPVERAGPPLPSLASHDAPITLPSCCSWYRCSPPPVAARPRTRHAASAHDLRRRHRLDRDRSVRRHAAGRQRPTFFRVPPGAKEPEAATGNIKTSSGEGTLTPTSSCATTGPGRSSPPGTPARPRSRPCSASCARPTRATPGNRSPASARPTTTSSRSAATASSRCGTRTRGGPLQRRRRQDVGEPRGAVGGRADRRRRRPGQPVALGRLDRSGHLDLHQRGQDVAPARAPPSAPASPGAPPTRCSARARTARSSAAATAARPSRTSA